MKVSYVSAQTPKQIIRGLKLEDPAVHKKISAVTKKYCEPYVPFRTGMLAVHKAEVHEGYVLYNVPYAKKMYENRGGRINKTFHPRATDHWDKAMIKAKRTHYVKAVAEIIKDANK